MESVELTTLIGELEDRVERLRALYDQYFMGIERLEPLTLRKDVDRRLWALRREQIRNTGLRFKLETVFQRYNSYQQYWQRIVREIENGTYQRDLGRAAQRFGDGAVTAFARRRQRMFEKGQKKRAERDGRGSSNAPVLGGENASRSPVDDPGTEQPLPSAESYDVALEDSDIFSDPAPTTPGLGSHVRPVFQAAPAPERGLEAAPLSRPPAPPSTGSSSRSASPPVAPATPVASPHRPDPARARPAAPPEDELSPARLRKIYGDFVEAKRKANESTAALTYEKLATSLRETARQLREQSRGKRVDFEVTLRDGKPVLKPILKK